MPAIDQCEPQVIRAFQKAGWVVTDQPYFIRVGEEEAIFADLRLEHLQEKQPIIVVEVKCFARKSAMIDEFYHAVGQYVFYRNALQLRGLLTEIYLSVPADVYMSFFMRQTIQSVINDVKIKVVVVDIDKEEIVSWIG